VSASERPAETQFRCMEPSQPVGSMHLLRNLEVTALAERILIE